MICLIFFSFALNTSLVHILEMNLLERTRLLRYNFHFAFLQIYCMPHGQFLILFGHYLTFVYFTRESICIFIIHFGIFNA